MCVCVCVRARETSQDRDFLTHAWFNGTALKCCRSYPISINLVAIFKNIAATEAH